MNCNIEIVDDSQHLYLKSLISLLKDDIETLIAIKKTIKKSYIYLIEEMISVKVKITKILGVKSLVQKENEDFKLDILNHSNFNLIEYLLDIEINQSQIFDETLVMLNYTNEKRHMISRLCKHNISLLKSFKYDT